MRMMVNHLVDNVRTITKVVPPFSVDNVIAPRDGAGNLIPDKDVNYFSYRQAAEERMKALLPLLPLDDYTLQQQAFYKKLPNMKIGFSYKLQNIFLAPKRQPKYLITSHYDHVGGEGAVDNASGMVIMAAVARLVAKMRKDVGFCCFDGEEAGLLGSKHFLTKRFDDTRKKLKGVLNIDSVGDGTLVNTHHYGVAPLFERTFPIPNIPVVTLSLSETDSDALYRGGLDTSTLSTVYSDVLKKVEPFHGVHHIEEGKYKVNVANSVKDTMDAIDPDNLQKAVDVVLDALEKAN